MSSLVPYPLGSAAVFVLWLLLNQTLHPAHLALAGLLALAIPRASARFLGARTMPRAPGTIVRLLATVLYDIVISNIIVARLVLGPIDRLQPAFVRVPLDVTHPYAISLLAGIITLTPGTVSADVSESRREILVHALNVTDADALVRDIKARYEAPLAEIFA